MGALAIIGGIAVAVGTGMQAVGQAKRAKAAKEAGRAAKELAYEDATRLIETTRESAGLLKRDILGLMGKQVSGYAASGVEVSGKNMKEIKEQFTGAAEGLIGTKESRGIGGAGFAAIGSGSSLPEGRTRGADTPQTFERPELAGVGDMDTPLRMLMETGTRAAGDVSRMMEQGFYGARRIRKQGEQYQAEMGAQAEAAMWDMGSTLLTGAYNAFRPGGWFGS